MDYKTAVQEAINGDSDSFLYLYTTTYTRMYHKAMLYVKNKTDAEDILQDSYIKAASNLHTLSDPDKFPAWLSEIVVNTSKNYLKTQKRKPLTFFGLYNNSEENENVEWNVSDEDNLFQPEEAYSEKEIKIILKELIDSLSDEQRVCILLHHFEEQTVTEIASAMRCSVGTVKSRLYYGRKALRKKVEAMEKKGYKFYGAAPISIFKYFAEKNSMTSDFLQSANISMENSKLAVLSQTEISENITTISTMRSTVVGKALAAGAAAFVVGGGVLMTMKFSDFEGFVKLLDMKTEMVENVSSVWSESEKNSDISEIIDNSIYDTNTDSDVTKIIDIKDSDSAVSKVLAETIGKNTDTEVRTAGQSGAVSKTPDNDSDNPTVEIPQTVTVTENIVPAEPQRTDPDTDNVTDNSSAIAFDTDVSTDTEMDTREEKDRKQFLSESYSAVLNSLDGTETETNKYEYYLADLDHDGTPELIVVHYEGHTDDNMRSYEDDFDTPSSFGYRISFTLQIYSCLQTDSGYEMQKIDGDFSSACGYMIDSASAAQVREVWNFESYMATFKDDGYFYYMFEGDVFRLEAGLNDINRMYCPSEEYDDNIDLFDTYSLYKLSDRAPFEEFNK